MTQGELTDAEFAILSLLGEGDRHGYEIETLIETRGMREWTAIAFSSIYFLLAKLSKRGLARPTKARGGAKSTNPKAAKVFSITSRGRDELSANAVRMLAEPNRVFPQVLLGMANWPALDAATGLEALRRRTAALRAEIDRLAARRQAQQPLPDFVASLFDYAIGQLRADLDWTERNVARVETSSMDKIDFK